MLTRKQRIIKRIFDISISIILLPFVMIPLILLIILASISMGRFGIFQQLRIGQNGKSFILYKIRSLRGTGHKDSMEIKASESVFGTWLRKSKLDELPQFFNVLFGDMSLVGPRPDIPGYADKLQGDDRLILTVKPGITGPATIKYKDEDTLLLKEPNPKKYNDEVIWPDKVAINKEYIKNWSLQNDIGYLFASLV